MYEIYEIYYNHIKIIIMINIFITYNDDINLVDEQSA